MYCFKMLDLQFDCMKLLWVWLNMLGFRWNCYWLRRFAFLLIVSEVLCSLEIPSEVIITISFSD